MNPSDGLGRSGNFGSSRGRDWYRHDFAVGLLLTVLGLIAPAHGEENDLASLLSGKVYPLTMALKDFGPEWRRITLQNSGGVSGNISINVNGNPTASTSQNSFVGAAGTSMAYVTRGEVVTAHSRTYLVAYRLPSVALNLETIIKVSATKTVPAAATLSPSTSLPMALLDLQTAGSFAEIKIFNADAEIAESVQSAHVMAELLKGQSGGAGTTNAPAKAKP